jgi:hypothetical protein
VSLVLRNAKVKEIIHKTEDTREKSIAAVFNIII